MMGVIPGLMIWSQRRDGELGNMRTVYSQIGFVPPYLAGLSAMALLADRFQLTVQRENKPIRASVLEAGKNGPKMEKAAEGESSTRNGRGPIDARKSSMHHFAGVTLEPRKALVEILAIDPKPTEN